MTKPLQSIAAMVAGVLALVGASCLVADPGHCANRAGDQTCSELGGGAFCSICASAAAGCVADMPEQSCYEPGSAVGTSTGPQTDTGSTSEVETGSETASPPDVPAPDCTATGVDPLCPETAPYCVDGTCTACTGAGGRDYCSALDADVGECHPDWGQCVACVAAADCGDEAFCDDAYGCAGCTQNSDCGTGACDLGLGVCFPRVNEYWVGRSGCEPTGSVAEDAHLGSIADPYCWVSTALDRIQADETGIVHLNAAVPIQESIRLVGRTNRRVAFVSVDSTPEVSGAAVGLAVDASSVAYVHNVKFGEHTTGVLCERRAEVWLEDVEIEGTEIAVRAARCNKLQIRRSRIQGNTANALDISDGTVMRLESSFVVGNGTLGSETHALRSDAAEFSIVSTTFAANRGEFAATLFCTGEGGPVRNSVFVSPDLPSVDCATAELFGSVLDTGTVSGEGLVRLQAYDPAWFEDISNFDAHVSRPGQSPFADVGVWAVGDPRRDIDGEQRLAYPGLMEFAGADQP